MNATLAAQDFVGSLQLGNVQRHANVAFIPLYRDISIPQHPTEYLFAPDALRAGQLIIRETQVVPELTVENTASLPILVLAGTYLQGGGQDRMVSASLIIGAGATGSIAVRCVEKQRWDPRHGDTFRAPDSGSLAGTTVCDAGTGVNQREAWDTIADTLDQTTSHSSTGRLGDAVKNVRPTLEQFTRAFSLGDEPERAVGVMFYIHDASRETGKWIVDIFGRSDLLKTSFAGLVEAAALRAVSTRDRIENVPADCPSTENQTRTLQLLGLKNDCLQPVKVASNQGTLSEGHPQPHITISHLEHGGHLVYASLRSV